MLFRSEFDAPYGLRGVPNHESPDVNPPFFMVCTPLRALRNVMIKAMPDSNMSGLRKAPPKDPTKSLADSQQISTLIRIRSKKKERDIASASVVVVYSSNGMRLKENTVPSYPKFKSFCRCQQTKNDQTVSVSKSGHLSGDGKCP